jgi:putative glutamine amidotransferase
MLTIGLTCGVADVTLRPSGTIKQTHSLEVDYIASLQHAATCLVIPPQRSSSRIRSVIPHLDGLILTGGNDVHPRFFGARKAPETYPCVTERTLLEFALISAALRRNMPILAICLGMQVLNIARGGDVFQHIKETALHNQSAALRRAHRVDILQHSILARLLQRPFIHVNSSHHQAINRIGKGLVVTARSPDGLAEAIEFPKKRFVVGVQWHPERTRSAEASKKLFNGFVRACGEFRRRKSKVES